MNKLCVLMSALSLCYATMVPVEMCRVVQDDWDEAIALAVGESCYFKCAQGAEFIAFGMDDETIATVARIDLGLLLLTRLLPGPTTLHYRINPHLVGQASLANVISVIDPVD